MTQERPTVILGRLSMVEWDRGVVAETVVTVFGWIRRPDGHNDFVYVEFDKGSGRVVWWATSSAKYSREITEALAPGSDHVDCVPFNVAVEAIGADEGVPI